MNTMNPCWFAVAVVLALCTGCVRKSIVNMRDGTDMEIEIADGGIDGLTNGTAVAVIPAPDYGSRETMDAKRRVYVELMRQLETRGCRLAARNPSDKMRPKDLDRLEKLVLENGIDTGYALAMAENAVEAPPPELIAEVVDCLVCMTSRKYIVVVRVRKPSQSGGRSFRSKTPDTDMKRAVSSLFSDK